MGDEKEKTEKRKSNRQVVYRKFRLGQGGCRSLRDGTRAGIGCIRHEVFGRVPRTSHGEAGAGKNRVSEDRTSEDRTSEDRATKHRNREAGTAKTEPAKPEPAKTEPPLVAAKPARSDDAPKKGPRKVPREEQLARLKTAGPVMRLFNLRDLTGWYTYVDKTRDSDTPPGRNKDPDGVYKSTRE